MQRYDFTKLGGFPFTQDVLKDMQEQYMIMMQQLCGNFGDGPYVLSGMEQSGGNITDGWFYYNGDLIPFTGGVIPTPSGTDVVLVAIANNNGTLIFNDGSTPVVKISPSAALTTGASVTDASHFPLSGIQAFGQEANYTEVDVPDAVGRLSYGTIYYKKNLLANTLHIYGVANLKAAGGSTPGAEVLATLPVGYRPPVQTHFPGVKDVSTSYDCAIDTNGDILIGGEFGVTAYSFTFSLVMLIA